MKAVASHAPPDAPALEVRGLHLRYGRNVALQDVTFDLPRGVLAGLLGPNGAGKSSLVRAILGLEDDAQGSTLVFGTPVGTQRARVAWVPQRLQVDWDFPLRVRDVVAQGRYVHLRWWQREGARDRQAIETALRETDLIALADRPIDRLSGGQQQRMILARALAQQADLLILDEPLAGVDIATEQLILRVLRARVDAGATVLVVHHDLSTAQRHFDHVLLLRRTLIAEGPPSEVLTRAHLEQAYTGALVIPEDGGFFIPGQEQ